MVRLEKHGDSAVRFIFTDSDHYLYKDGVVDVPVNSLSLVIDESEMVTFKKASTGDPFISFRLDKSNFSSRDELLTFYKENMVGAGGISEEEVQQMIDAATSGIPSSQVVEQLRTDVNAVSGDVSTLQDDVASKADSSALTAVNNVLTAHTANTTVHVTQAEKNTWNGKVDEGYVTDYAYSKNQIDGFLENATTLLQTISGEVDTKVDTTTYESGQYATAQALNALQENKLDASAYTPTDLSQYWTSGQTQEAINAATSGIPSSEVVEQLRRDVNAVSGEVDTKQDILTAGENITISGNVISADAGNNIIELTQAEYDALVDKDPDVLYIITDASEINMNDYATKTEVDASIATKADTSALTAVNNVLTAHTANTEVHVTQAEKNTWDGKLDASAYTPTDLSQYWTSGQTQEAINAATSGIPSSQVIEQLRSDVNTISGKVDGNAADIIDIYDTIDLKEEVIASALTEVRQDVAAIDAKEEVIASALTEIRQDVAEKQDVLSAGTGIEISGNVISATGGALFVNFDDLMENMNDEKWDELVDALQNNKPIFGIYNGSEGDITNIEQYPVDGYVYINQTEGEESANIDLRQMYGGGYRDLFITKNGSEDYEFTDDYYDYQPMLQAGSGIIIDEDNVISVTVDSELDETSNNPVANSAITNAIINNEYTVSQAINSLNNRVTAVESGGTGGGITSGEVQTMINDSLDIYWTSAQTQSAIDSAKAYYIDFGALTTQGIHDADWDGMVNAINAHRPIYAGLGGEYYVSECLAQTGNQIILTASNHLAHFFYTFTKNGSENYSFSSETRPYTTTQEKTAWSAKQDALTAGSGISISNNVISTSGVVMSQNVTQLVKLTQAAYDALATKDSSTLYIISD